MCDLCAIGLTPHWPPIVPEQGHFLGACIVRQTGAKPAALVYYKRRDCSIQSLQQRTFKLHILCVLQLLWFGLTSLRGVRLGCVTVSAVGDCEAISICE